MEKFVKYFRNYERKITVYNALQRSQQERERPRLDEAQLLLANEFKVLVLEVMKLNKPAVKTKK